MGNFSNLISFHKILGFQNRPSHSKVTATKLKVSNFNAEHLRSGQPTE